MSSVSRDMQEGTTEPQHVISVFKVYANLGGSGEPAQMHNIQAQEKHQFTSEGCILFYFKFFRQVDTTSRQTDLVLGQRV